MPKGYWIARVDVTDAEGYKAYIAANAAPIARFGGRFLVRAGRYENPEGSSRSRNVVVEFPSYRAALDCHHAAGLPGGGAVAAAGVGGRPDHRRGLRRAAARLKPWGRSCPCAVAGRPETPTPRMSRRSSARPGRRDRRRRRTWNRADAYPPGPYVPNEVPLGTRLFHGVLVLTWAAWALVGLMSGHMYFVIGKGSALHFSGVAALVFCAAVLASAAACAIDILDHHDRRDNEAVYDRWRGRLWWAAVGAFGLACAIGLARHFALLDAELTPGGLLPASLLQRLLVSQTVAAWLAPHAGLLRQAALWSTLVCVASIGLLKLSGRLKQDGQAHPVLGLALLLLLAAPLGAFTLMLVGDLAAAPIGSHAGPRRGRHPRPRRVGALDAGGLPRRVGVPGRRRGAAARSLAAAPHGSGRPLTVVARPPTMRVGKTARFGHGRRSQDSAATACSSPSRCSSASAPPPSAACSSPSRPSS